MKIWHRFLAWHYGRRLRSIAKDIEFCHGMRFQMNTAAEESDLLQKFRVAQEKHVHHTKLTS